MKDPQEVERCGTSKAAFGQFRPFDKLAWIVDNPCHYDP